MKEKICRSFGQRVRKLREERGYSQEAFAEIVGIDRTYISGIERGVRNPTLTSIAKIAAAMKITPSKLLEGV